MTHDDSNDDDKQQHYQLHESVQSAVDAIIRVFDYGACAVDILMNSIVCVLMSLPDEQMRDLCLHAIPGTLREKIKEFEEQQKETETIRH